MGPYVRMVWQRAAIIGATVGALVALLYDSPTLYDTLRPEKPPWRAL